MLVFLGHCKEYKNFNSLFAIISGLGHTSVNRLRQTWEKLPTKYSKLFADLQDLMDPSRNMSKYRQLVASVQNTPPLVSVQTAVRSGGGGGDGGLELGVITE